MKTFRNLLLFITSLFFMGACSESSTQTVEPPQKDEITFDNPEDTNLVVDDKKAEQQVTFVAKKPWTSEVSATGAGWLSVAPTSGAAGANSVKVSMQPNDTYESRTAEIMFHPQSPSRAEAEPYTIVVTQAQKDALVLAKSSYTLDEKGGDISVKLGHNVDFAVQISCDWIEQVPTRAFVEEELMFRVKPNEEYENREATITFLSQVDQSLQQTVKVYQANANALIVSPKEQNFDNLEHAFEIVIKSNVEYTVTEPQVDWLHRQKSRALTETTLSYLIDENRDVEPRSAKIIIESPTNGMKEEVVVTQMQKDALVIAPSVVNVPREGKNVDIKVGHNIDYELVMPKDCDWIQKQEKTRGVYQEEVLTFVVAENTTVVSREAMLVFKTPKNPDLQQIVEFRQEGKEEHLDIVVEDIPAEMGGVSVKGDGAGNYDVHFNYLKQYLEVKVSADNKYKVEIERQKLSPENLPSYAAKDPKYEWFEYYGCDVDKQNPEKALEMFYMDYNGGNGEVYDAIERRVTLRFVSESGKITRTVSILQDPATMIQIDPTKQVAAPSEGGIVEVPFSNNSATPNDFTVEVNESWLRWVEPVKSRAAMTEVKFKMEVDPNPSVAAREAMITVRMKGQSEAVQQIPFKQKGQPGISLSVDSIYMSSKAGNFDFYISSSVNDYTIPNPEVEWLMQTSVEEPSFDEQTGVWTRHLNYRVEENTMDDKRETILKINHSTYGKQLRVVQDVDGKVVVDYPTSVRISRKGDLLRIPIQRNIAYEVACYADWIVWEKPTRGMVNDTVYVRILPNTKLNSRSASFTIMPIDNDGTKYTSINVSQNAGLDAEEQKVYDFLEKFYNDTDGKNWSTGIQKNWLSDLPFEEWAGVNYENLSTGIKLSLYQNNTTVTNGKIEFRDCEFLDYVFINNPQGSFTSIIVDNCPKLRELHVNGYLNENQRMIPVGEVQVTNCPKLDILNLEGIDFKKEPVFSNLPLLTRVYLGYSTLPSLDCLRPIISSIQRLELGYTTKLTSADLHDAPNLSYVNFYRTKLLKTINIQGCTSLTELNVSDTPIETFDLSTNTSLTSLKLENSMIRKIDISKTAIAYLNIMQVNHLSEIIASQAPSLKTISIYNVKLDKLVVDAQNVPNLQEVKIGGNLAFYAEQYLRDLQVNVQGSSNLTTLQCCSMRWWYEQSADVKDDYNLTKLNVTGCEKLQNLYFNGAAAGFDISPLLQLKNVVLDNYTAGDIDLTPMKNLVHFDVHYSTLGKVTFKDLPLLAEVHFATRSGSGYKANNNIEMVHLENCPKLANFDISYNERIGTVKLLDCPMVGASRTQDLSLLNNNLEALELRGEMPQIHSVSVQYSKLTTLDLNLFPNLEDLYINDSTIGEITFDKCPKITHIWAKNSHLNQEFTSSFYRLFKGIHGSYTPKYTYQTYVENGEVKWKVIAAPYGLWFPGEPASHEHRAPAGW